MEKQRALRLILRIGGWILWCIIRHKKVQIQESSSSSTVMLTT